MVKQPFFLDDIVKQPWNTSEHHVLCCCRKLGSETFTVTWRIYKERKADASCMSAWLTRQFAMTGKALYVHIWGEWAMSKGYQKGTTLLSLEFQDQQQVHSLLVFFLLIIIPYISHHILLSSCSVLYRVSPSRVATTGFRRHSRPIGPRGDQNGRSKNPSGVEVPFVKRWGDSWTPASMKLHLRLIPIMGVPRVSYQNGLLQILQSAGS